MCIDDTAGSDDKSWQVMMKRTSNMMPRILGGFDLCIDDYVKAFYNTLDVQEACHVSDYHHLRNWSICNEKIFDDPSDSKPFILPIYKELIASGSNFVYAVISTLTQVLKCYFTWRNQLPHRTHLCTAHEAPM